MKKKLNLLFVLCCLALNSFAQHFVVDYSAGQGDQYSVIVPFPTGITLDVNDEIVVIDANGFGNAGVVTINATTTFPVVINTYLQTTVGANTIPGAIPGNPITFKIWDASEGVEYDAIPTFGSGTNGTFGNGFACQVTVLTVTLSSQLTINVAEVLAYPNSTASIDISIENPNNVVIEGILITIFFDPTLTLGTPSFTNDPVNFPDLNYDFVINDVLTDRIIIVAAYNGVGTPFNGSGTIGSFQLNVPASAVVGDVYYLTLGNTQINELPATDITLDNGSITIQQNLFTIQGDVITPAGTPVSNATLSLVSGGTTNTAISNPNYSFTDLLLGDWTMTAEKTDDLNGVSAYDGSKGLQYLAGLISFTPYQLIALDVSGNGTVSASDASEILQYVASIITNFSSGKDWVFVAEPLTGTYTGYDVPAFSETKSYLPLNMNMLSEQWIAVRLGDITGNWASDSKMKLGELGKTEHYLNVKQGDIVKILVSSNEYLTYEGIDALSEFDLEYLNPINAYTNLSGNYFTKFNNGKIAIASSGNASSGNGLFLVLEFEALKSGITPFSLNTLQVNEQDIEYTLAFEGATTITDFEVISKSITIFPNPCTTSTTLSFPANEIGKINIQIFNTEGKIVNITEVFNNSNGVQNVELNTTEFVEGVYFCKIIMPSTTITKKFVVIK